MQPGLNRGHEQRPEENTTAVLSGGVTECRRGARLVAEPGWLEERHLVHNVQGAEPGGSQRQAPPSARTPRFFPVHLLCIERREIGVSQYLMGVSSAPMSSQLLSVILFILS